MDLKASAVNGPLLFVGGTEDFVIHGLSGAPPPDRWCHGHLLKLQASRRHTFDRQAKQLML
jgi:hypothetical protein